MLEHLVVPYASSSVTVCGLSGTDRWLSRSAWHSPTPHPALSSAPAALAAFICSQPTAKVLPAGSAPHPLTACGKTSAWGALGVSCPPGLPGPGPCRHLEYREMSSSAVHSPVLRPWLASKGRGCSGGVPRHEVKGGKEGGVSSCADPSSGPWLLCCFLPPPRGLQRSQALTGHWIRPGNPGCSCFLLRLGHGSESRREGDE